MALDVDFTDSALIGWQTIRQDHDIAMFEVAMRVKRLALILKDQDDGLAADNGLSVVGDYEVLAILRRSSEPLQPSAIAGFLKLTRAGVTGRLNRLEEQGYLQRATGTTDARSVYVSLTDAGRRKVDETFTSIRHGDTVIFGKLTTVERRRLAALLRKVLGPIDDGDGDG